MKRIILSFFAILLLSSLPAWAQDSYFPPADNAEWATQSPESLGWDTAELDELLAWLDDQNTKAFIILKDGKLVVEQYYDFFGRESEWYWASAGKTITAFLIGALEKQGLLEIHYPTSDYLGTGWTSLNPAQEELITPWHQLTMTTGFDYNVDDLNCTLPECLQYRNDAGEQWYYHNAPYTLVTHVAEAVADTNLNAIVNSVFEPIPGLELRYADGGLSPFNKVVVSRALDMARFGLLISRETAWEDNEALLERDYYSNMLTPSQELNPSYGYLWWLNGQDSFIPPGFSIPVNRSLTPEAPDDMVSALGLNTQVLSIVPSQNLIVIRMGEDPGSLFGFVSEKWERLSEVIGTPTSVVPPGPEKPEGVQLVQNYPNPFNPFTIITYHLSSPGPIKLEVFDLNGRLVTTLVDGIQQAGSHHIRFDAAGLGSGLYYYRLQTSEGNLDRKMMLLR